jgi:hypothetical protein
MFVFSFGYANFAIKVETHTEPDQFGQPPEIFRNLTYSGGAQDLSCWRFLQRFHFEGNFLLKGTFCKMKEI